MNILYITALHGGKYSGLTSAVPKHIESQSKFDNVFWYNVIELSHEIENCTVKCHTIKEFPKINIKHLPKPFNNPDLVIFEDFYYIQFIKIAYQLKRLKIPYIIVPHCCFCELAQKTKRFKKTMANYLLFYKFSRNAVAIHYLTKREYMDSGKRWNKRHFILPNGAEIPDIQFSYSGNKNQIIGSFIARLDINHKGLDLLAEAVSAERDLLRNYNCHFNIYGADSEGDASRLKKIIKVDGIEDLFSIHPPVYGKDKIEVLKNTDFFVLTSRYEGHPMGLIEALSYGIPALITYGTNMGEEVLKYNAGWVSETSVYGIRNIMKEMIVSQNQLLEKGKNARRLASRYHWDNIAQRAHDYYSKLTNKG